MFVEINGEKLFYQMEGTGIPCLVPSLAGFPIYQRPLSQELREHYGLAVHRSEGIDVEAIERLKSVKGVSGFHIMAIEWEQKVPEIVERAGLYPRPEV